MNLKTAARTYAYLETVIEFKEAVDLYLALQDLNNELGQETEPMESLAPLVADYPEDLPQALVAARIKFEEYHAEINRTAKGCAA